MAYFDSLKYCSRYLTEGFFSSYALLLQVFRKIHLGSVSYTQESMAEV